MRVLDAEPAARCGDDSRVADLAAGFRIERSPLEKDVDHVSFHGGIDALARPADAGDPGLGRELLVTGELGLGDVLGERPSVGHGVARALAPGHLGAKPLLIDLDASLRCQLTCELERKTEGVVQAKSVRTRDCLSTARLDLFKLFHPLLEGPREAVRLCVDRFSDESLALAQLWIVVTENLHRAMRSRGELLRHRNVPRVQARAADESPQDVAATLVGWHDAIRDAERDRAHVVRNDPLRQGRRLSAVVVDEVDERTEQVGLENVFLSLQDEADPLQAHARVDGRVLQRYKGAVRDAALDRLRGRRRPGQVRPLVVLGQHQVPELGETGAVVGIAVRLAASRIPSAVPPDLGVGPAGSTTQPPPVVAKPGHVLRGDRCLGGPDLECLVVRGMHRRAQTLDRHPKTFRHELPSQGDRRLLEVVASRREVAEHLKEGEMPFRLPHLLDVACA